MAKRSKRQQYISKYKTIETIVYLAWASLLASGLIVFGITGRISVGLILSGISFMLIGGYLFFIAQFTDFAGTKNKLVRQKVHFFVLPRYETKYISSDKSVRSHKRGGIGVFILGICLTVLGIILI